MKKLKIIVIAIIMIFIDLTGTPLSQNKEEMRKLKEAFPDINIIIEDIEN